MRTTRDRVTFKSCVPCVMGRSIAIRLFDLSEAVEKLLNASLDPDTGEICEEALTELAAMEMSRDEKALAVAAYAMGQRAEADAVKAQADRLAKRAHVHANHSERLKRYIADCLPVGTKVRNDHIEISWRKSVAVEVTDEAKLDESFWHVRREVIKRDISDAIKAGQDVPGAHLVTRMNLVIR